MGEELGVADDALDHHDGQQDPAGILDAGRGIGPPQHPQQNQQDRPGEPSTISAWIRVMSSRPMGIRLAPLPPAWGPVPVVAAPAASTTTMRPTSNRVSRSAPVETARTPRPGPWPARRVSTTATASSAIPTMKWAMTT